LKVIVFQSLYYSIIIVFERVQCSVGLLKVTDLIKTKCLLLKYLLRCWKIIALFYYTLSIIHPSLSFIYVCSVSIKYKYIPNTNSKIFKRRKCRKLCEIL